jgi:hypothetical protein
MGSVEIEEYRKESKILVRCPSDNGGRIEKKYKEQGNVKVKLSLCLSN